MNMTRDIGSALIAILFFLINASELSKEDFKVRGFSIASGAMLPTLEVGDQISVDLNAYVKIDPARGDIVVFQKADKNSTFVFRVLGLPNEKIQIRKGRVFVNGSEFPQVETAKHEDDFGNRIPKYQEMLENGKSYEVLDTKRRSLGDNTREFAIPKGHFFVLGDNRDNSADSRFEIGLVPRIDIIGRVFMIHFSKDHTRIGTKF